MKLPLKYASVLLALMATLASYGQKVDTIEINGEQVFVYPFKVEVAQSRFYLSAMIGSGNFTDQLSFEDFQRQQRMNGISDSENITREDFNSFIKALNSNTYRKFKKYYRPLFGPLPSKEEFKRFVEVRDKGIYLMESEDDEKIFSSKKFKKAVRKNPYPFLIQRQSLDYDLVPMLDPIPDGKYVQYYESFCMLQIDGSCEFTDDQIAGYFTMKDNKLDGEATWVNIKGDTIKHGFFKDGLKVEEWTHVRQSLGYFGIYEAEYFIEHKTYELEVEKSIVSFENGIPQGNYTEFSNGKTIQEGQFEDGEKVGEWTSFWEFTDDEYLEKYGGKLAVKEHFFLNDDDSLVVKPFLIRNGLLPSWDHDPDEFNFFSLHNLPRLPSLYKPAFHVEENFELDEELYDDSFSEMEYYGDEYYEGDYYGDEYYGEGSYDLMGYERGYWGESFFETRIYDNTDSKRKERGLIFDSLGAHPNFRKVYERYYSNGQLAFRYEFENGLLKEEPVIYWDNGKIHDKIEFIEDSNFYVRTVYDYDGKIFGTQQYDSSGRYQGKRDYVADMDTMEIDGLTIIQRKSRNSIRYDLPDSTLALGLDKETLLYKEWEKADTSRTSERSYYPETNLATFYNYNVLGDTLSKSERIYSDGFESWTGPRVQYAGPYSMHTLRSASLYEWSEVDSIPITMIVKSGRYDVNYDHTLYFEDEPYTGPLKLTFGGKKLKISEGKVNIPQSDKAWQDFDYAVWEYRFTGKLKKRHVLTASVMENDYSDYSQYYGFYNDIFGLFTNEVFDAGGGSRSSWEDEFYGYGEDSSFPKTVKIEGYFMDGKPQGLWQSFDQFGNVRAEANYNKGMLDGKWRTFDYAYPVGEYHSYYRISNDSFPDKKTYYLSGEYNFKNGQREGTHYNYNWYGMVELEANFRDDYRDGLTIERNEIAVSYSEFKDGMRDGYSRTYLTLPDKDSILLFDLNFQNGALQGESISYHTNGKVSKRGFFLQGEPIEDYEGYDTLGFKYHYVKFEYGFPIEEKLWEENELSVRYTFNWEDSIEFIPLNITDSESLDALLVQAGLSGGWEYQPYYGRRTIVDKGGVDYHLTKYYPNDTVSRDGAMSEGKKSGFWEFFSYEGEKLYEVNYFDTLLVLNDSIKFNAKGIYTDYDSLGNELFRAYIIEKSERFDCSHKDHYEVRQFYTISETSDTLGRMNGEVYNFYDNGTLQSYGKMKNGLPDGEWRYYDPAGKLNKYGEYVQGKRNGRWLMGDLSKTKYLGDICLNPNMPDVEEELRFRENFLDIQVINYRLGSEKNREYYDINMNEFIEYDDDDLEEELSPEEE